MFGSPETDWFLVPDAGSPDGSKIIVTEKRLDRGDSQRPAGSCQYAAYGAERSLSRHGVQPGAGRYPPHKVQRDIEPPVYTFEPTKRSPI